MPLSPSRAANQHGCRGAARRSPSPTLTAPTAGPVLLRPLLLAWRPGGVMRDASRNPLRCRASPVLVTHLQARAPASQMSRVRLPRGLLTCRFHSGTGQASWLSSWPPTSGTSAKRAACDLGKRYCDPRGAGSLMLTANTRGAAQRLAGLAGPTCRGLVLTPDSRPEDSDTTPPPPGSWSHPERTCWERP